MRPEYCKLCTMTEEYGLVSKSFLSIFLQCKPFCSTVPLILLMSLVHLGLLFPFLPSHVKSLFLHKGCLTSYFYLLLFLFPHIITHSLWFLLQLFHSNFPVNLCFSFTFANRDPHDSFGHSFLHLSCQSQLPFILPQSTLLVPIYPLQVLLMSLWI